MSEAALATLYSLPDGTIRGSAQHRGYIVTKTRYAGGKSIKLVAHELGGSDYISLNAYLLADGPKLFPCEMSLDKVTDFLTHFAPDL